ncbi:MAG: apolipoprotein N-acyltransferase [Treponema sp.]|nr:apolipoprotein N-acyltransferase [Treponema sp.]
MALVGGREGWLWPSLVNLAAVAVAAVLFAASFPSIPFPNGLPLVAWVAYVPVFWVVRRAGTGASAVLGALYGYAAYGLFNYWLSVFHPLAGIIVGSLYSIYMAVLFVLLHLAVRFFPRRGYILQFLLWMAYEYVRTLGFLGYSYGVTGYSQWQMLPVIQIAAITGVWGVSALVVFPSAWLAAALSLPSGNELPAQAMPQTIVERVRACSWRLYRSCLGKIRAFFRQERAAALAWCALLAATLVYGLVSPVDYSGARKVKFALIQHNTDPWLPARAPTRAQALDLFRADFNTLRRLSDEALAAHPDTEFVVWSETAFVPRIHWHSTFRHDRAAWYLVRDLLEYLAVQDVPFLIGNHDARRVPAANPPGYDVMDFNAVILFERGEIKEIFRKIHLVPFTEHFPFRDRFPRIYRALQEADTHFWDQGTEFTVFESQGLRFSTPICFEDTFGYLNREFARRGAEVFVNLSNDAWSQSLSAQMQHLTMAVFRSVENRRAMVRSTSSGMTCAINPNGRITAMAEPFAETWLVAEVPVVTTTTFYTRFGDWLGVFFTAAGAALLIFGGIFHTMNVRKRRKRN